MADGLTVKLDSAEEWGAGFEKELDSAYKAIKKVRESLKTMPVLPLTTEKKFKAYLNMFVLELQDAHDAISNK